MCVCVCVCVVAVCGGRQAGDQGSSSSSAVLNTLMSSWGEISARIISKLCCLHKKIISHFCLSFSLSPSLSILKLSFFHSHIFPLFLFLSLIYFFRLSLPFFSFNFPPSFSYSLFLSFFHPHLAFFLNPAVSFHRRNIGLYDFLISPN